MRRSGYDYDLAIIGGGSAGMIAGGVAGALGARVALVEKNQIGGECLWTGCVPSKALLHAADVAQTLRTAGRVGFSDVVLSREACNGAFAYARQKVQEVKHGGGEQALRDLGVDLFFASGQFRAANAPQSRGPHLFATTRGDIKAGAFLLATGSSPRVPAIEGLREAGFLTNKTLYDLDAVPESIAIVGGGYIACEMGQALARLGARVTLLCREARLLIREDEELAYLLADTLEADGIQIEYGASVLRAERTADGKRVTFEQNEQTRVIYAAELLVATGRRANSDGLGLETIGVQTDDKGSVRVDAYGCTTSPTVWACGDVTGQFPFSHMAEHEAKIVVRNLLFPGKQAIPYDVAPWATFTDPELARVGLTEAEAQAKYGASVRVFRHPFTHDDRAIVENQTRGLVKVVTVGENGRVVGAHILGPNAGDLIHEWVIALRHNLPIRALADLIHVYPTVSVSNQRAAQRWYSQVLQKPVVKGALSTLFGLHPRDSDAFQ